MFTSNYIHNYVTNTPPLQLERGLKSKSTLKILRNTRLRTQYTKYKHSLLKLKLQSALQTMLATPVTITCQNLLKLKASKVLLAYS
jgi:hypothetical protein